MAITTSVKPISFALDAQLAEELLTTIRKEQSALIKADVSAIEQLLDEKSAVLQRMNTAVLNRYEALAANSFEPNEDGMTAWLKSQSNPTLHQSWAAFKKILTQAKELNRLNGILISKQFNTNKQFLNHLQGKSASGDVYSRNGQAKSQTGSRGVLLA